jgi:hypothetical protein
MTAPPHDRRTAERFALDPAPRCRLSPLGRPELPAVLLDLSSGGAALSLGAALPVGDEFVLKIGHPALSSSNVSERVVYCATQKFGTILGCRFREPLGDDAVKALVGAS